MRIKNFESEQRNSIKLKLEARHQYHNNQHVLTILQVAFRSIYQSFIEILSSDQSINRNPSQTTISPGIPFKLPVITLDELECLPTEPNAF